MIEPGILVRVDYTTDTGHPTWYRATVVRPSTQRTSDWEVRVVEVGPHCTVAVGALLSPITGHGIELVPDPSWTTTEAS